MILLATVRSTGSRFMTEILVKAGLRKYLMAQTPLGVDLSTDWEPFEATTDRNEYNGGMTLDEVKPYLQVMPFEQFGYEV